MGLDTKTYWLTDRQSHCDFDFDLSHGSFPGSNTSTVALRVVGGNEKGSLESEAVKYGRTSPMELGPGNDYAGERQQKL
jgi:hypothetical protein